MHGAEEADLVYSGLEETMITATHEIMNCWKSNPTIPDMRTAARDGSAAANTSATTSRPRRHARTTFGPRA